MDRLYQMRLYVRIVETGSFSAVARELGTIQPTVSKQLTALEEHLGVRLLNRTTRQLSPTEAGRKYYDRCRHILDEVTDLETSVADLQTRTTGLLRINAPVAFGQLFMLPLVFRFRRKYPGLAVDLTLNDRFVDLVQEGVDVAIRFGDLADSQVVARRVGAVTRVCVASPEYLHSRGTPRSPADLSAHNCITYNYLFSNEWQFEGPQGPLSVRVKGDFRANSALTIRAAALEAIGIAHMPVVFVQDDIDKGTLTQVLADYGPPPVEIHTVYPSARFLSSKVRLFLDFVRDQFLDIPALQVRTARPKRVPRIRAKVAS
ncbi:MAG TPA: LysR family transcriptional regulator [Burkholderiales bacterium]|nr:LysR family transcriptional regulator [Burkholderiales bacterium]